MQQHARAGNKGEKIRSDCELSFELTASGGINIQLESKVKALYGEDITKLCHEILTFYKIKNARLELTDSGALPFVIAARIEAAVRLVTGSQEEFLLPPAGHFQPPFKERFRFSRLYLPGNTPSMMLNAAIHEPHGLILDLEDSVSFERKHEARILVRNALRAIDFFDSERMVRINQLPLGLEDLRSIIPHGVHTVLLPKCETPGQIQQLEKEIERIKPGNEPVFLMPIIESALGVENAFLIAQASERIVALAIGLEDYTADLGVQRSVEGSESLYARTRIVNACKAAGIQAIDSVFSDVDDEEGLKSTIKVSKSLGFEGMGCIHPRQVRIIHEGYAPSAEETEKAARIVLAYNQAQLEGKGVVSLGSKMIDAPVVKRARRTIELAEKLRLYGYSH